MLALQPIELEKLAYQIKSDIDAYCVDRFTETHRDHLGASLIGHDCGRHIWYAFRWAKAAIFDGRMLRLFERGKNEEDEIDKYLMGIGFRIYSYDLTTGKQYRITGAQGHYGGSLDAIGIAPYPEFNKQPMLIEKKTHNKGSFSHLVKNKLVIGKPQHYAQMCAYGVKYGFEFGLYFAVCKDNDDIYIEIVPLNPRDADDLTRKAEGIIYSQIAPPKISLQEAYFECKLCTFAGICHRHEPMEKNCRSCRFSHPVADAQWYCEKFGPIPKDFIPKGCDHYYQIGE